MIPTFDEPKDSRALAALTERGRDGVQRPTKAEIDQGLNALYARIASGRVRRRGLVRWTLIGIGCVLSVVLAVQIASVHGKRLAGPERRPLAYRIEGGTVLEGGYLHESGSSGIKLLFTEGSRLTLLPGTRGRVRALSKEGTRIASAYYQSMDTTKIASDGFSCGGLMSENASGDSRLTAVGITSSGLFSADQNLYNEIHTPFKILLGGTGDMAYTNGERDYTSISALGVPIILFSKDGGGDLFSARGGDFTAINLAWLNWQLKGDETATGKALLIGSSCKYCNASGWEFKSANIP